MCNHRTLFFFTSTFPYGQAETFIEDEIGYLSNYFEKVVIVPLSAENSIARKTPPNCIVLKTVISGRFSQYLKGLLMPLAFGSFVKDFFGHKVYVDKRRFKAWLIAYVQANNLLASKTIRGIFKKIRYDDLCYFYWGKGANVLSFFYKGKAHYVSRFHGEWDLWEESSGNYAPMRQKIVENLDAAVFISKKGKEYFEEKYKGCNTYFYPLGSIDMGCPEHVKNNYLRVLSCSSVYPLKRVPLIFEAVKEIKDFTVCWTHIGGGSGFEDLKKMVNDTCPSNLKVRLLGEMPHEDVMKYYSVHQFDVFVNVSTNEGVPVSIMEALSFGIPVVATDVGGNSEVVNDSSGILVNANPRSKEVANAILQAYHKNCDPRLFWERHYSAELNYSLFAKFLKSL